MRNPLLVGLSATTIALVACAPRHVASGRAEMSAAATPSVEGVSVPRVNQNLLVSAGWLAAHLNDRDLVLLHVAPNRTAYDEGHLPGARFLPTSSILTDQNGDSNELPPVERLDSVFEAVGVSDNSRIVVYGPSLAAARAFFTLDYLGHGGRVALLDGSVEAWKAGGRSLTAEVPRIARGNFTPRPQPERVGDAGWVSARLGNPRISLIDARPRAQFTGAEPGDGVARPGHIPGAANLFWEDLFLSREDPRLKDLQTLHTLFRQAGVNHGDTVVAYCRSGMQASFAYFVARYLGYETRMYDGSFLDWSRRTNLPVER